MMQKLFLTSLILFYLIVAVLASGSNGLEIKYVGEKILFTTLQCWVVKVKYSHKYQQQNVPDGNLFLIITLAFSNTTKNDILFPLYENINVYSSHIKYNLKNDVAITASDNSYLIKAGVEQEIEIVFTVPEDAYDKGSSLSITSESEKNVIDLGYTNPYDGNRAHALELIKNKLYKEAVAAYLKALHFTKDNVEDKHHLYYKLGELYSELFIYEEAIGYFKKIGKKSPIYKSCKVNIKALKKRIKSESKKDRSLRLVEAGYNHAFKLGDTSRALAIFKLLQDEYSGIKIGDFTSDEVALLYISQVYYNDGQYKKSKSICEQAIQGEYKARQALVDLLQRQIEECSKKIGETK